MTVPEILMIAGMAAVTFGIRGILLLFSDKIDISGPWERALAYVPPAVLAGGGLPAVLMPAGSYDITPSNYYLVSGAAALCAGFILRRHALWAAIVTGLSVFALWKFIAGPL